MLRALFLFILTSQWCLMVCRLYNYHYINEKRSWTEAQQYCREKHTDLATVSNMEGLNRLLRTSAGTTTEAWIGLYDQTSGSRTWHWSLPGVEFNESVTNWKHGEPNDAGTENCGMIWKHLRWGDVSCTRKIHFICYDESNNSEKFHLIQEKQTWLAAQSYCRENYTDLVSGLDQLHDEQLRISLNYTDTYQFVFIGLFRDTWRWSDGNSFSFRHWNKEFNDEHYNSGQCAMAAFTNEGRWKNEKCTARKPFICYDDEVILVKENKTWEEALYYCRDHHHDLVTITNLDEQRWVQEKAKKASTDYVWMGLQYNCTLKFWSWVCPEVVTYKTQNSEGQADDCKVFGAMETGGQHLWFQRNGEEKFNFMCSRI